MMNMRKPQPAAAAGAQGTPQVANIARALNDGGQGMAPQQRRAPQQPQPTPYTSNPTMQNMLEQRDARMQQVQNTANPWSPQVMAERYPALAPFIERQQSRMQDVQANLGRFAPENMGRDNPRAQGLRDRRQARLDELAPRSPQPGMWLPR